MVIESTPRPPPIRVRIDQRFPTDEERAAAVEEDPAESVYDMIPDGQRVAVLLQWINDKLAGLNEAIASEGGHLDVLAKQTAQSLSTLVATRETLATIDKRIAGEIARNEKLRTDALEEHTARPLWLAVLDHKATRPALGLLTWLGGMASMGLLDYLGLESEPVFRLIALIWGL